MSLPLYLAAAVPLTIVFLLLNTWWDRRWKLRNVPSPAGSTAVWGHEKTEFEDDGGAQWRKWFRECGKAFKIKGAFGHPEILVVGDTVALSHIYAKNTYNYAHSPVFRPLIERLCGKSLIWVEGEQAHRKMRSLVAPAFSIDNVRRMAPDVYHVAGQFRDRVLNSLHAGNGSVTINAIEWTAPATLDVIGRVAFGHDFGSIAQQPDALKIINSWKAQNEMGCEEAGFTAMLVLRLFPWISSLPVEAIQAQGAVANTIRALAKDIVGNGQIDEKGGKDLMSLMLKANASEKNKVDIAEIYDHVVTFVVAGHETTSAALAFTLWSLAQNQDIQTKLREEINSFPGEPTYDDLAGGNVFPYLDAVGKEALRMFPASSRNEKVAEEDDVIPLRHPIRGADGSWIRSIPVKAGQVIHIPSIGINRDEDVWGDADTFRPTRWLVGRGGEVEAKYCTPGERGLLPADEMCGGWAGIFTFSEGPRACVGMRLALFEYKVILLTLVKHFQLHDTGADITLRHGSTLAPRVRGRESEGINLPIRITHA